MRWYIVSMWRACECLHVLLTFLRGVLSVLFFRGVCRSSWFVWRRAQLFVSYLAGVVHRVVMVRCLRIPCAPVPVALVPLCPFALRPFHQIRRK